MTFKMPSISRRLADLEKTDGFIFDAIVVGSGYGGGVAACRLAQRGRKVSVLERGREILPGSYPTTLTAALAETQVTTAKDGCLTPGSNGMLDLRVNEDITVIVGCGLGGTSLINANVALETDPRTFESPRWPSAFREPGVLDEYYRRARKMLGSNPLPDEYHPPKLKALEVSAKALGARCERPDINVTFRAGRNAAGIMQAACTMCGDCCSGCNYGAKNTVLMNYLQEANKHKAVIVTEAKVLTVGRAKGTGPGWEVVVTDLSPLGGGKQYVLTAEMVVLAAGTLGSTEILLRSARNSQNKLPLAERSLGQGFSGNGDVFAFGFDANWQHRSDSGGQPGSDSGWAPVYGFGAGTNSPDPDKPQFRPGPCITGVIKVDMGAGDQVSRALVIEEGVAPGALSAIYPMLFSLESALKSDFFRFGDIAQRLQDAGNLGRGLMGGTDPGGMGGTDPGQLCYTGALSRTQSFLLMSHDQARGVISFKDEIDTVEIQWPRAGSSFPYNRDNAILRKACDGIWANFIADPVWYPEFGRKLVTVHPVGGCCMGDDASSGVVNHRCEVFTGEGDAVHEGLYVCDGSVIPTSLGLNPLLTITAIAERAMDLLIRDKGWASVAVAAPTMPQIATDAELENATDLALKTFLDFVDDFIRQLNDIVALIDSDEEKARTKMDLLVTKWILELIPDSMEEIAAWISTLIPDWKEIAPPIQELIEETAAIVIFTEVMKKADMKGDVRPAIETSLLPILEGVQQRLKAQKPDEERINDVIAFLMQTMGEVAPELNFRETMAGFVSAPLPAAGGALSNPHELCERLGRAGQTTMQAQFAVAAASITDLFERDHKAALTGTIRCPMLSDDDLKIAGDGAFQLLAQDTGRVESWRMIYTGSLRAAGAAGPTYYFQGVKTLERRPGSNWWSDLTTLAVDVYEGTDKQGRHVARGLIRLGLQDLLAQARSIDTAFRPDSSDIVIVFLIVDLFLGSLHRDLKLRERRRQLLQWILSRVLASRHTEIAKAIERALTSFYEQKLAAFFGTLIFRTYGGVLAYMYNFPARREAPKGALPKPGEPLRSGSAIVVEQIPFSSGTARGKTGRVTLQFLRCNGGNRGPVILAPGFATRAASFAIRTVETNLVDMLCAEGFDVWMFDYRGSPALGDASVAPFTLDDIALDDWPAAVDLVLARTQAKSVSIVAHCMGSMTAMMALLSGKLDKAKVRTLIASQLTVHPVTNWLNKMKADTGMAGLIRNGVPESLRGLVRELVHDEAIAKLFFGLDHIDANSSIEPTKTDPDRYRQDQALNVLMWGAPFPNGMPCYSPTCHRIFGIYGPVYLHEQLNEATHDAIQEIFGCISTKPFEQIGLITAAGQALDAEGGDAYLKNHERLELPITFIAGNLNEEFLPDTSLATYEWLCEKNRDSAARYYQRRVFDGYGHLDCFIGKNASRDIFPFIVERLKQAEAEAAPA